MRCRHPAGAPAAPPGADSTPRQPSARVARHSLVLQRARSGRCCSLPKFHQRPASAPAAEESRCSFPKFRQRPASAPAAEEFHARRCRGPTMGQAPMSSQHAAEMRLWNWQEPQAQAAAPPLPTRRALGRAERRQKRLTKHDQCCLQIGHAGCGRYRSRGERSLEKEPGFLKGILDVAAGQILIEAGLLRQYLHHRLLQFWRQAAGRGGDAEICKQWRLASLLCGRTLRRHGNCHLLKRRQFNPGRRRSTKRRSSRGIGDRIGRQRYGVRGRADRRASALSDNREPDTVRGLRYRKLQDLADLQRNFRENIDRKTRYRDPHQIVGEKLEHLGIDHTSRLQHEFGRCALGGNHRKDRIDGDRHVSAPLGCGS
jgi:hypothetical protein